MQTYQAVTPFVGVWIEINTRRETEKMKNVTPFVGVWIEIIWICAIAGIIVVTPFVGVWIEMIATLNIYAKHLRSLPSWECGLKSYVESENSAGGTTSLPSWECGLKSGSYD